MLFSGRHKGSYGEWSRVVGGILQANDVKDFLGNEDELYKRKVSTPAMTEFVTAWKERWRRPVRTKRQAVYAGVDARRGLAHDAL